MPTLSRWFVRTALAALLLGFGLGAATAGSGAGGLLAPTVIHLLVVGWLTQMVFGVAFWLFPKFAADRPRGFEWLGWVCYGTLNAGLLLRVVAEPIATPGSARAVALAASAMLQLAAAVSFAINTWPRLKGRP